MQSLWSFIMRKLFYSFIMLFVFTFIMPTIASAEKPKYDYADSNISLDSSSVIARPHRNPGPPGVRPNYNRHHINPGHHYYAPRYYPRRYYAPVVVYSNDTNTAIVESEPTVTVTSDSDYHIGFGIRGLVAANSPMNGISNDASGGVGLYLTVRPSRYFSLEFVNDYLFGTLKYDDSQFSQGYVKIPFSIGARFHFLDYGSTDAYLAAAASISAWSYADDYDGYYYDWYYDEYYYTSKVGMQFGGQFGAGVSYVGNSFEIGIDLRYTLESVPDYIPGYDSYRHEQDSVVHGFLLAVNIGFSL